MRRFKDSLQESRFEKYFSPEKKGDLLKAGQFLFHLKEGKIQIDDTAFMDIISFKEPKFHDHDLDLTLELLHFLTLAEYMSQETRDAYVTTLILSLFEYFSNKSNSFSNDPETFNRMIEESLSILETYTQMRTITEEVALMYFGLLASKKMPEF